MRARPMWRPVHYRMHSSCLDSLRHEIFHQTKAQVKGLSQGRARCVHTYIRTTDTHTQRPQKNTHGVPWSAKGKVNYAPGLWRHYRRMSSLNQREKEPQCFKAKYLINCKHWMSAKWPNNSLFKSLKPTC